MEQRNTERNQFECTIGLDVGDRRSVGVCLDEAAEVVEEFKVSTTPRGLRKAFVHRRACRVVIEVGTHSPWISELLEELEFEVVVANARRVKWISESNNKTDETDAEALARLGRSDLKLLAPIRHRGRSCRRHLCVIRARDAAVAARTQLVNHVRQQVKVWGCRLPSCSTVSFYKKVLAHLPEELRPALVPLVEQVAQLSQAIRRYDIEIERLCEEEYPETSCLRQVSGVGPITALCFVLTLEDPSRFAKARSVGPYLGLSPKKRKSGRQDPELSITKAGDRTLRRLLVGAAHYILGPFGPETDLRAWGLALAARGGKNAKKRAVVATARKLSVLLLALWRSGLEYEPQRRLRQAG